MDITIYGYCYIAVIVLLVLLCSFANGSRVPLGLVLSVMEWPGVETNQNVKAVVLRRYKAVVLGKYKAIMLKIFKTVILKRFKAVVVKRSKAVLLRCKVIVLR